MNHILKTDPESFQETEAHRKKFEIRLNDRNYQVGDTLTLRETMHTGEQMAQGQPLIYTGNETKRLITYIMRGPIYGLAEGWVIMSVRPIVEATPQDTPLA